MEYCLIEIFTSESARFGGTPVAHAVLEAVRSRRIAARVHVYRGTAAAYEGGEYATVNILDLSANLPVKVEILLPAPESEPLLPLLAEIVSDGVVAVRPLDVVHHRSQSRLLPKDLRVADIMTPHPITVDPDTPVLSVVRILMAHSFRGLPVVDSGGRVVGIITDEDLVERAGLPVRPGLLSRLGAELAGPDSEFAHLQDVRVGTVMTAPVDTIGGSAFAHEAVRRMVRRRRRTLPVVDGTGRLVGMVSRVDVLTAAGHWTRSLSGWQGTGAILAGSSLVRDAVAGADRCVAPQASVLDVAGLIAQSGVRRVAVVGPDHVLMGIVAEADVLKALEPVRAGILAFFVRQVAQPSAAQRSADLALRAQRQSAGAVMTRSPVVVRGGDSLETAAELMLVHRLKELPAIDETGRFLGFLSRMDLMRAIAGGSEPPGSGLSDATH